MTGLPVVCSLPADEIARRRDGVLAKLLASRLETRELPDGIAFRFAPSSEQLAALVEVIDFERQCCQFLRFRLTIEPGNGPVWLELTGPEGTREMLVAELGLG